MRVSAFRPSPDGPQGAFVLYDADALVAQLDRATLS